MIERRAFGSTGHQSSRVIFGAAALGSMNQEQADRLLPLLLQHGVNHLDTAASYGDAELRMAPWLTAHPGEFYVATKTGERTGSAARAELELSLTRLGLDRVDLVQLHNLVEDDEWEIAHAPGGVVEALLEAQAEGLVGHIGVTGHGLRIAGMHLRSIERFPFDTVLFPYSYVLMQEPSYRRDVEQLIAVCSERGVAIQTIKSVARRRWTDDDQSRKHSWYEPLRDEAAIARAVRYVLGDERVFLNSTSDASVLPLVLAAAEVPDHAVRPNDEELEADVQRLEMRRLFDGDALERI